MTGDRREVAEVLEQLILTLMWEAPTCGVTEGSIRDLAQHTMDNRDTILAALRQGADRDGGAVAPEIVRHVATGAEYEVLRRGVELQVSVARGEPLELLETTLDPEPVCAEGDRLVVYCQVGTDKLWAREETEFDDGRFEPAIRSLPASGDPSHG